MTSRRSRAEWLVLTTMAADQTHAVCGVDLRRLTGLSTGTLYPLLRRLEERAWMSSVWEEIDPVQEGRPRRRLYRLTEAGVQACASYG